jgi:nitrate/nitrite transporter NarK
MFQALVLFIVAMMGSVQGYMVPRMMFGDILKKTGLVKEKLVTVEFVQPEVCRSIY